MIRYRLRFVRRRQALTKALLRSRLDFKGVRRAKLHSRAWPVENIGRLHHVQDTIGVVGSSGGYGGDGLLPVPS
jgi:hypothetical protein